MIRAVGTWTRARGNPGRAKREALAVIAACRADDREARLVAMRTLGWVQRIEFAHDDALATLGAAIRLARAPAFDERAAELLITRAGVHLEVGDAVRARRDLARARDRLGGATAPDLEVQAGILAAKSGHIAAAVTHLRDAVASLPADAPQQARTVALNNLAMALTQLGRGDEAVMVARQAEAAAGVDDAFLRGAVVQTLALANVAAGRLPDALREFDRAATLLQDSGWPAGEAYLERIEALARLRLLDEADRAASEAVAHLAGPGGAMLRADALLAHAKVLIELGREGAAVECAESAAELFRAQRRGVLAAAAESVGAAAALQAGSATPAPGDLARAAARLERAGWLEHAVDARLVEAELAALRGATARRRAALTHAARLAATGPALLRVRGHLANLRLAQSGSQRRAAARRGLAELMRFRGSLPTADLRARASGHGVEFAREGLRAALAERDARQALVWMERGRMASSLVVGEPVRDPQTDELLAHLREVQAAQFGADPLQLTGLREQERRIEGRIERLLRQMAPERLAQGRPPSASEIGQVVRAGRSIVMFGEIDGRLIAVTHSGRATIHDLGAADAAHRMVDEMLFGLRRMVAARSVNSARAAEAGLRASLAAFDARLAPALAATSDAEQSLIVVPTGALLPAPWHALRSVGERRLSVMPSLGTWLRRPAIAHTGTVVCVAGPALEHAAEEVRQVAARHRAPAVFAPSQARVVDVAQAMDGAAVAHLACHGRLRIDNPSFSSLRLHDGDLTLIDLERLRRPPGVLILAACDVGRNTTLPGEELRGFLSAALSIGTTSLVASTVPVNDRATMALMDQFHERLGDGQSVGASLRAAGAAVDPDDPVAVAGALSFACYGDSEAAPVPAASQ